MSGNGCSVEWNLREVEYDNGVQGLEVEVNKSFKRYESEAVQRKMLLVMILR